MNFALIYNKSVVKVYEECCCCSEFGKSPAVVSFEGNHVGVRRSDGAQVSSIISPHVPILHGYAEAQQWPDALRLCRALKVSQKSLNSRIVSRTFGVLTYQAVNKEREHC